jgi:hypothetical protein
MTGSAIMAGTGGVGMMHKSELLATRSGGVDRQYTDGAIAAYRLAFFAKVTKKSRKALPELLPGKIHRRPNRDSALSSSADHVNSRAGHLVAPSVLRNCAKSPGKLFDILKIVFRPADESKLAAVAESQ